jgi:hypothetical protein
VTDNVEGILEARLGVRLQVCVICTAFCTNSYGTNEMSGIDRLYWVSTE